MATVEWEEAIRCPKCDTPGRDTGYLLGPGGVKTHSIVCVNERCVWFDTNWAIQVQSDGTIPVREDAERQPKVFPKIGTMTPERAAAEVSKIDDTVKRD